MYINRSSNAMFIVDKMYRESQFCLYTININKYRIFRIKHLKNSWLNHRRCICREQQDYQELHYGISLLREYLTQQLVLVHQITAVIRMLVILWVLKHRHLLPQSQQQLLFIYINKYACSYYKENTSVSQASCKNIETNNISWNTL